MTTFTVTAQRGVRRWVLQCEEFPGALSEVTRLADAESVIREAIGFVAGIPQDSFDVAVVPVITKAASRRLKSARDLRDKAISAQARAAQEIRAAAVQLAADGLPLRDIGSVLGVSYQRVHQLLQEKPAVIRS